MSWIHVEDLVFLGQLIVLYGVFADDGVNKPIETTAVALVTNPIGEGAVYTVLAMGARVMTHRRSQAALPLLKLSFVNAAIPAKRMLETVHFNYNTDKDLYKLRQFVPIVGLINTSPGHAPGLPSQRSGTVGKVSLMDGRTVWQKDLALPYMQIMFKGLAVRGILKLTRAGR
ncbi:hypothetical protein BX600DRAFT_431199 [Xylariales sp. PMI_506]|nr:hypothetical protein BX600DRAFT_431199 [Xylariales sp. PMI_506]